MMYILSKILIMMYNHCWDIHGIFIIRPLLEQPIIVVYTYIHHYVYINNNVHHIGCFQV